LRKTLSPRRSTTPSNRRITSSSNAPTIFLPATPAVEPDFH
jgi:hypothetical protein